MRCRWDGQAGRQAGRQALRLVSNVSQLWSSAWHGPLLNNPWHAASTLLPSPCSLLQLPDAREVENRLVMLLDFDRWGTLLLLLLWRNCFSALLQALGLLLCCSVHRLARRWPLPSLGHSALLTAFILTLACCPGLS